MIKSVIITHNSGVIAMSLINRIKHAFTVLTNTNTITVPAGVKSLWLPAANNLRPTHAVVDPVSYKGSVTTEDLVDLNSSYIRNAIAQLGAWTALAKGFSAFLKDPKTAEVFIDEFHAWNAVTTTEHQMNEEATLTTVAKLTVVKPARGNDQTDAIIARVRKISVDAIRAEREAKAAKDTQKREEAMLGFSQLIWQTVGHGSDSVYSISGAKAVSKAIDTMQWISNWSGDPDQIAGELLLCEADVAQLEIIARKESEREGESQGTFE